MLHWKVNLRLIVGLILVVGCGRRSPSGTADPEGAPPPAPAPLANVFVLESNGPSPDDTTIRLAVNRPRTIIIRRGAPDNSLFAELEIPDSAASGADSAQLTIEARPGVYGVDINYAGTLTRPITLTMSYAVYFEPPAESKEFYPNNLVFERALFIARVDSANTVTFLRSTRPGSDLLRAKLPGPGRYLVAARRP
jgi:hypothetical protein